MPMTNKTLLLLFAYLLIILSPTNCQANTHQTISTGIPKMFKLNVVKGDKVVISIFNTNAQFEILFQLDSQDLGVVEDNICFAGEKCSSDFVSEWNAEGIVIIQVVGYEYSYEIIKNDQIVIREDNVLNNFVSGKFIYTKSLQAKTYDIQVFYQSQYLSKISLIFMEETFTIKANKINNITVTIQEFIPFYQFHFKFGKGSYTEMSEHLFSVDIQLPNQMLKGCDGSNLYDPKIRACPILFQNVKQDSIDIRNLGSYPTFQLTEQQNVSIKITILQQKNWNEFFQGQFLTLYVANYIGKNRQFNGMNKFQIGTKYKTRKQCQISSTSCTFVFLLKKGNYTVMPVFPRSQQNSFTYLYQRSNGVTLIQSYYSVLPTLNTDDKKFYQIGTIIQFVNGNQRLTELIIESQDAFLLIQYSIFQQSQMRNLVGEKDFDVVEMSMDSTYNKDLYKAKIYTQLKPNRTYLLFVALMSQSKYLQAKKQQDAEGEELFDFQNQNQDDDTNFYPTEEVQKAQDFFYLETESLLISIKNGKFPHKKLPNQHKAQGSKQQQKQQKQQQQQQLQNSQQEQEINPQQEQQKQHLSTEQSINPKPTSQPVKEAHQRPYTRKITYVLGGILVTLVILLLIFKFCFTNSSEQKHQDRGQLVTEQHSGNVTIADSSIEISQVMKTQSENFVSQREDQQKEDQQKEENQEK